MFETPDRKNKNESGAHERTIGHPPNDLSNNDAECQYAVRYDCKHYLVYPPLRA